jgi:polyisoprenoid-binding protein YceI
MPLTGWIGSSAKGYAVSVFGWFTLPNLVGQNKELAHLCYLIHDTVAWGVIALIVLHVAGALKHAIIDRDGTLRRMLPFMAAFFLFAIPAHAENWVIDGEQSSLTFDGTQMGAGFIGRLTDFDGEIVFDPANPAAGHALIKIKMASTGTGSDDRDAYIGKKEWFDSESFPESVYKIDSFEKKTENQYIAHGQLTLKGVTLPVDLPFTLTITTDQTGNKVANVEGEATLKRLDFGIGTGEWADTQTVGNEVIVRVSLAALADNAAKP